MLQPSASYTNEMKALRVCFLPENIWSYPISSGMLAGLWRHLGAALTDPTRSCLCCVLFPLTRLWRKSVSLPLCAPAQSLVLEGRLCSSSVCSSGRIHGLSADLDHTTASS